MCFLRVYLFVTISYPSTQFEELYEPFVNLWTYLTPKHNSPNFLYPSHAKNTFYEIMWVVFWSFYCLFNVKTYFKIIKIICMHNGSLNRQEHRRSQLSPGGASSLFAMRRFESRTNNATLNPVKVWSWG